ncbi:hypothetical protein C0J52_01609 [Blattella germanica]|nr:hypothetical protein C0J52_01609 [Blattella germanica]
MKVNNKSGDRFQNGADVIATQTSHENQSGDTLSLPTLHSSSINMKTTAERTSIWKDMPLMMATAAVGTPGPQPINMDLMTILFIGSAVLNRDDGVRFGLGLFISLFAGQLLACSALHFFAMRQQTYCIPALWLQQFKRVQVFGLSDRTRQQNVRRNKEKNQRRQQMQPLNCSLHLALSVYRTVVEPVVMYTAETWCLLKDDERRIAAWERKILRIYGPKLDGGIWRIRNRKLNGKYVKPQIIGEIKSSQLSWAGHEME